MFTYLTITGFFFSLSLLVLDPHRFVWQLLEGGFPLFLIFLKCKFPYWIHVLVVQTRRKHFRLVCNCTTYLNTHRTCVCLCPCKSAYMCIPYMYRRYGRWMRNSGLVLWTLMGVIIKGMFHIWSDQRVASAFRRDSRTWPLPITKRFQLQQTN